MGEERRREGMGGEGWESRREGREWEERGGRVEEKGGNGRRGVGE